VSTAWSNGDCDNDGLTNGEELTGIDNTLTTANPNGKITNPLNSDSDGDGVCNELEILGCMDVNACNYASNATNPGQCQYAMPFRNCQGACINDSDQDGVCNEQEVVGCLNDNACNYNSAATDIVSCIFPQPYYNCQGQCITDADSDGVCDQNEIVGEKIPYKLYQRKGRKDLITLISSLDLCYI
jgi:hypothetical protein